MPKRQTPSSKENANEPLSRIEAEMVMDLLVQAGKRPMQGWRAVWRLSPNEIAERYKLPLADVLRAIRRTPVTA